jgi:hypothetical protein
MVEVERFFSSHAVFQQTTNSGLVCVNCGGSWCSTTVLTAPPRRKWSMAHTVRVTTAALGCR